ncbi:MAG: DUF2721 domain-containing protein [Cyanobacteria bacterium P01_H01_bin.74]
MDSTSIISDALSPVVIISGLGLLIFGMNNRLISVGSRVRQLDKEFRDIQGIPNTIKRQTNIEEQLVIFIRRAKLLQNAIFLLFGALALMILTTFVIALLKLTMINWPMAPLWTFFSGLFCIFMAVVLEGYETILNIRTLSLDVAYNAMLKASQPVTES